MDRELKLLIRKRDLWARWKHIGREQHRDIYKHVHNQVVHANGRNTDYTQTKYIQLSWVHNQIPEVLVSG